MNPRVNCRDGIGIANLKTHYVKVLITEKEEKCVAEITDNSSSSVNYLIFPINLFPNNSTFQTYWTIASSSYMLTFTSQSLRTIAVHGIQ